MTESNLPGPDAILRFWFEELSPAQKWQKDPDLDAAMLRKFASVHAAATRGECWKWRSQPEGRLAEIILLDQFSRNMFRDRPESFASDSIALVLAQEAVSTGADLLLPLEKRLFIYMPYMHSESLAVHTEALRLFDQEGMESNLEFEKRHLAILQRFGRYPHRNTIQGRRSTTEELEFLTQPGSSF